jgi:polar amino acid transport system substrate-binding protein
MTTIAAIALHGVRLADVRLGERVAVVGCGLVGQIACRLLTSAGAEVFALDLDAARIERAVAAGADHGLLAGRDAVRELVARAAGIGLDHVIVTAAAGSSEPLLLALEAARDRGSVTLVGDVPIEMPREPLYLKELDFRVSRSYGPGRYDSEYEERGLDYPIGYVRWTEQRNMEAVLDLQARRRLGLSDLVEEVIPVERAAEAYTRITGPAGGRPLGAILLDYGSGTPVRQRHTEVAAARHSQGSEGSGRPAIGLIGPGSFARQALVPALSAAGARLELVGGGSGPSAEQGVRELGFARYASSAQDVVDDPAVDVVVIASRHSDHATLVRSALRAGKHVFCEKPLALSVEELDATLDVARKSEGILAVGFNRRFSPFLRELAQFARAAPGPVTVLYRVSSGELPAEHWQNDPRDGGGRILGEACHFIDSVRFLTGNEIVAVHSAGHSRIDLPRQSLDNVVMSLECADGSVGSVTYVASSAPQLGKERVEVFGAAGIGVLDDYRTLELHRGGKVQRRRERSQHKGHREEIRAFVEGVEKGQPPVPLAEIENSTRATLAAVESLLSGRRVALRPT